VAKKPETKAEIQARARNLHEAHAVSFRNIADRMGISLRTVCNWAERGVPVPIKGPWVKGSLASKVQQAEEDSTIEAARIRGMDKGYFLDIVKTMLEAETRDGKPNFDVVDKGLVHAERIIPGLKAEEKVSIDFPAKMLGFFQDAT
jgi:transposase